MGTVEKVKGKAPSNQVAAVISTTVNNAVTYRSVLYCTFISCQITPVLTWTMSTIQNQKGSASGFKLLRPRNEEPVKSNLNQDLDFNAKLLLLPVPVTLPRITIQRARIPSVLVIFFCVCFELSNSRCITFRTVGWRYRRGHPRSYGERRH